MPSVLKHEKDRQCLVVKSDDIDKIHTIYQQWRNQYEIFHFEDKKNEKV